MFKILTIIITMTLTIFANLNEVKNNNNYKKIINENTSILQEQSLTLAFNAGNFYNWNEHDETNTIAGIFTTSQSQSYLLNKDGSYNNLDLSINNFIRFTDSLGIATLNNFHKNDGTNFINHSFLISTNGIDNDASAINTLNHTFASFGNNVVSTDIGADLIKPSGEVTTLVLPYHFGKGKTSFTAINDTFGVFVGGNQNYYLLKVDGSIKQIIVNAGKSLVAPNPLLLDGFVSINNKGGIIRDNNGQLFYLAIDSSDNPILTPLLDIDKITPLFSTTTNFFTKTNDNVGILNVNIKNNSKFFGQPYYLDINDSNDIKLTKINQHYLNNFILFHTGLGIFIDEQQIGYFVDQDFTFTKIGLCTNFQKINDNLGIIDNNSNKLLLSDNKNENWVNINSINFIKTKDQQLLNFINAYLDKDDKVNAVDRTNNYITNNSLNLNVTNNQLENITIDQQPPLLPNINNNITTIITTSCKVNIKFKNKPPLTYHLLIYQKNILPTLDNSSNTNFKYVGIVNNNLYDINSTNTKDGFTINFNYKSTIQFINIITIDNTTMSKINSWILKPNTTFNWNPKNNEIYLLQTVNWNNISNWQYFTIYNNNLIIPEFWTTTAGNKLWNIALKMNYTPNQLKKMNAEEINNLRNLSINWKITKKHGNTLGYIICGFLVVGFILIIIAIIYDWYLKQQLNKAQSKKQLPIK